MKRRATFALLVALVTLFAGATSSYAAGLSQGEGIPLPTKASPLSEPVPLSQAAHGAKALQPPVTAGPTERLMAGPGDLTGTVLDAAGNPVADASVWAWYKDGVTGDMMVVGYTDTLADGSFVIPNTHETTGGEIDVFLPTDASFYRTGLTYTAAGPNEFILQPGLVNVELTLKPGSTWKPPMRVETQGEGGGAECWVDGAAGTALVAGSSVDYAVAYTYDNEAIEKVVDPSIAVTPGATNGTIAFNQADALSAAISYPPFASGKAGREVKIKLSNWPAGDVIDFEGYAVAPSGTWKAWSAVTATGAASFFRALTIPSTAPSGYAYNIMVFRDHIEHPLYLNVTYQVASFASSSATIRRGTGISLGGRVPTIGHWGSDAGLSKTVTLYKRTSAAGVPTNWDATKNGWTRVLTMKADGYGKYRTSYYLKPSRTTWYIVRYPGDAQYRGGYTSIVKVVVR
jgi:hypothetical protein